MIELNQISFGYGDRKILNDISLMIPRSQMTAIMGLNGTGKTTLIRLMTGSLKSNSGVVSLMGQDLTGLTSKERARKVGFVPQEFSTEFPFIVREFLEMGRFAWQDSISLSVKDYEVVARYVSYFKLDGFLERNIQTLSGGEKQRVLLARVFIQDTPIIILDEPLNHLDIKNRAFVMDSLKKACVEESKTIVAVLHDLESLERYFDQVAFLKEGRVYSFGCVKNQVTPDLIQEVFEISV